MVKSSTGAPKGSDAEPARLKGSGQTTWVDNGLRPRFALIMCDALLWWCCGKQAREVTLATEAFGLFLSGALIQQ